MQVRRIGKTSVTIASLRDLARLMISQLPNSNLVAVLYVSTIPIDRLDDPQVCALLKYFRLQRVDCQTGDAAIVIRHITEKDIPRIWKLARDTYLDIFRGTEPVYL
jgi:hypothetical protein